MQVLEADETPSEQWLQKVNATCNRLSTQYLHLLQSGSAPKQANNNNNTTTMDARLWTSRGHRMEDLHNDPPPPALASEMALQTLQCQLATENICAAASEAYSLIRTLRLSLLLMDVGTQEAEASVEWHQQQSQTVGTLEQVVETEQELLECRQQALE